MIEAAVKATGRSIRQLAAKTGMSDTRWRHIIKGWQPAPGGSHIPVRAPAATLARIASVLELSPEQLTEAGREDAATLLARESDEIRGSSVGASVVTAAAAAIGAGIAVGSGRQGPAVDDEIDMIYQSRSMTAQQKLYAIRMVLQLRLQAESDADGLANTRSKSKPKGVSANYR